MDSRVEKKYVDVICQHIKEGMIIPIKIRVTDEDGELQTYQVRQYRERSVSGEKYRMPNEVWVTNHLRRFKCKINIFSENVLYSYTILQIRYHVFPFSPISSLGSHNSSSVTDRSSNV